MPKRTSAHRDWLSQYMDEFLKLAQGKASIDVLIDDADQLHARHGHKDPKKIAAREFARMTAPKRELIPGFNAP